MHFHNLLDNRDFPSPIMPGCLYTPVPHSHNIHAFFFFFHKTIITQILIFNPLAQADSLNKITPIPRVGEMKRTRIKNGQTSFFSHTLPGSGLDHDPSVCAA